ncbi:Zinc finger protein 708 [Amphibalanus amphitrite]|uniref:Zinc finger protein 708 n=1 Tax=Amphibalanus amphitrite TaxID=1232801 RepID=A0A6A4W1L5_AMPAM|nr:Zinc finger protein 708 [Amphibalanus amphitrite]
MDPLSVSDAAGVPPAAGAPAALQVVAPPPATVTSVRNPLRLVRPPKVTGRLIRPQVVSVVSAGGRTQTRALPVVKIPVGAMSAVTSSMFVIKPRQSSPEQKQAEVVATQPVPAYETAATVLQTPESEEICQSTHESGTRYSCEVCEQSYARLDDLTRHTRSVHNQKRQFRCPGCMRRFTQKRIVEYHMRTHESSRRRGRTVKKGNRLKKENGELEDIKDSPGPGPVKYTCEECGAGFDTRRRFIRHQQMRHDAEAPRYECEVCSATYTRIDELTRHSIQIHHQKKTVPCPRCTRLFTQQRIVDYHVRGHDTKRVYNRVPRPYRCETCQRSFSTQALLVRHNCRDKTSTQRCVCDICGRGVSCPQALRRHRLQHLEERPAKCDTCGAAFIDDVALSKHVLTHSDEKPFLCDHCGKGFRFKDYLVRHTRFHTGERPYPCSACDKRFATSDTLHRHFLIHTGEKPYVCEMCGRPFRQAQQLKTHMKIHNKYSPSFTTQQGSSQRGRSFANAKPAASAPTQLRLTELTNASGAPEVPATGAARLVADESGQLRLVEEGHADVTLQEIHTFETQVL